MATILDRYCDVPRSRRALFLGTVAFYVSERARGSYSTSGHRIEDRTHALEQFNELAHRLATQILRELGCRPTGYPDEAFARVLEETATIDEVRTNLLWAVEKAFGELTIVDPNGGD